MNDLTGKVAFVTGAGRLRGIGRACAVELARLGADVVVTGTGRNPETFPQDEKDIGWKDVESTAEQVRALGRRAMTTVFDVTDPDAVHVAVEAAVAELGRIDILINNAAVARGSSASTCSRPTRSRPWSPTRSPSGAASTSWSTTPSTRAPA